LTPTILAVTAGSQQFALAEGFEKYRFSAIGMHIGHVSRVGYPEEFIAVVGVADRGIGGQVMEIAFQFVFIVFDIYLSEHAHNISPLNTFG
jgi:hypothetical protein